MSEAAVTNWPVIGLILAGELLFGLLIAALTRIVSKVGLHGQTYWLVVLGVAGVVIIAGAQISWANVAFLAACFGVAGLVMGVEYFTRIAAEHKAAEKIRKDSIR